MKNHHIQGHFYPFCRYQYKWLPFGASPAGDIFKKKIDKQFNDMPNVFHIADDILITGFDEDGRDHDKRFE